MNKLIIEVRGGVAEVTASTVPIEVLIVDWDNIQQGGLPQELEVVGYSNRDFNGIEKELREPGRGMAGQHVTINPHTVMSVLRNLATRKPEMNAELKALKTN